MGIELSSLGSLNLEKTLATEGNHRGDRKLPGDSVAVEMLLGKTSQGRQMVVREMNLRSRLLPCLRV